MRIPRSVRAVGEFLYWDVYYTVGFSFVAGAGNGLSYEHEGENFGCGFGEAVENHFPFGLGMNILYPAIHHFAQKTDHYRTLAHVGNAAISLSLLIWHFYAGTEHPINTMAAPIAIGVAMTERNIHENLEKKVQK